MATDADLCYRERLSLRTLACPFRLPSVVLLVALAGAGCSRSTVAPDPTPPTSPPQIACPVVPPTTTLDGISPVAVNFADPVVTAGKAPFTTSCAPPSGTFFQPGTTTVNCKTTDALQRSASCAFTISVVAPPQISLTRFVAFGDSITWGEDGRNSPSDPLSLRVTPLVLVPVPYPAQLNNLLQATYTLQAGRGAFLMSNKGCPGETAGTGPAYPSGPCGSTAADRFRGLVASGAYQAALILEGANDLSAALGDSNAQVYALAGLRQMVETAKAFNVRPYLATLPPENVDGTRGRGAPLVAGFNQQLAALAASESIDLVDVYQGFGLSLLSADGLHPNQAGYIQMAQVFFDKLKATLQQQTTASSVPVRKK